MPKYSLIIPVWNGMPYLEEALEPLLECQRRDFEMVISDGGSTDGSREWIRSLEDSRVRFFSAPRPMSMADHWDWAQNKAIGEWQLFLGQDDSLQLYALELLDLLSERAAREGLRAVVGRRAYLNWPGLSNPPKESVMFNPGSRIYARSTSKDVLLALASLRSYHFLPQMYTSSLVRNDLIADIRRKQHGRLILAHPQDASLAASICRLESRYLYSELPFSWVGTSKRSVGRAILVDRDREDPSTLSSQYLKQLELSPIKYPGYAGPFSLGDNAIYFWQALREVDTAMQRLSNLHHPWVVALILALGFIRFPVGSSVWSRRIFQVRHILRAFRINRGLAFVLFWFMSAAVYPVIWLMRASTIGVSAAQGTDLDGSNVWVPYGQVVQLTEINDRTHSIARKILSRHSREWEL